MPDTAQRTSAMSAESAPAEALTLDPPGPGRDVTLVVEAGQAVFLGFAVADGQARIDGDTLQFLLRDGGVVNLEGFLPAAASGRPPVLVMSDGTRVAGDLLIEALESLLREAAGETAAGPDQAPSGAAGAYEEHLGDLAFAGPQEAGLAVPGLGLAGDGALEFEGIDVDAVANIAAPERRLGAAGDAGGPGAGVLTQNAPPDAAAVLPGIPRPEFNVSGPDARPSAGTGQANTDDRIGAPGDGADEASGGPGADEPEVPAANVSLRGGSGDDALDGGAGDDELRGGKGRDSLTGGPGDDKLRGQAGDDTLDGGAGDDLLDGGSGDDILIGGPGADLLKGGAGADIFVLEFGPDGAIDVIADFKPKRGDVLNLHNLLADESGNIPGLDADSIDGYVRFTTQGGDTVVSVDPSGSAESFTAVAILDGVRGLDVGNLFEDSAIDVTAAFG